jgi:hypothetical protein
VKVREERIDWFRANKKKKKKKKTMITVQTKTLFLEAKRESAFDAVI